MPMVAEQGVTNGHPPDGNAVRAGAVNGLEMLDQRNAMKHVITAVIICASVAACSYRSERVVERPQPAPATATVVTTPPPSSTVVVPAY